MSGQEMVVAIVAISVFGGIATTFKRSVYNIINKKMDKSNSVPELDKKFFEDYIAFKQEIRSELSTLKNLAAAKLQVEKSENGKEPLLDKVEMQGEDIAISPRLKNMLDQKK